MSGPIALVGSGEYLPVMAGIEAALLEGRPPRYVQLATAAALEGPAVLDRWHTLGAAQAARLGVEQVVVPVVDRASADDPTNAGLVVGAGLVYLSGGNPSFLAETLVGSRVWDAIRTVWEDGAALAGCSAGAMALTSWVPHIRHPRGGGVEGLGLLPHLRVIPHFDAFFGRMPDLLTRFAVPGEDDVTVLGIDEDTALVGGPDSWEVQGRQSVWHLHRGERRQQYAAGETVATPVPAAG